MSRTTRTLPSKNGRTYQMRGRNRAQYIEHRVQKTGTSALLGLAMDYQRVPIPAAERAAMKQQLWDAYLAAYADWEHTRHQGQKVTQPTHWDHTGTPTAWKTTTVYPAPPPTPHLYVPKTRAAHIDDKAAFLANAMEEARADAAHYWDSVHRDGGIDRCGRKDRGNQPTRKAQRAKAREACKRIIRDIAYADEGAWQDILGTTEHHPHRW